jgi:hypothetical protein
MVLITQILYLGKSQNRPFGAALNALNFLIYNFSPINSANSANLQA